ncbi:MAG: hypothetical protein AMJ69_06650 [Gammaproteobacteria bacterium SG8_47]|nr:MAG: hypothetical protein AMJ69_06650 [Gammaproteobacteria bacterium SG8_47]
MSDDVLEQVTALIDADPRSGQSLLLYALVKALSTAQGHYLYTLKKLRELQPAQRLLAYALMEQMAQGLNETQAWRDAVRRMDEAMSRKY